MVAGFAHAPRIEVWAPPAWLRNVTMVPMLPVFVLLAAAYMPGDIRALVKIPMPTAIKTWAVALLLINGDLASMLLLGSFPTFIVVDLLALTRSGRSGRSALVAGQGCEFVICSQLRCHIAVLRCSGAKQLGQ